MQILAAIRVFTVFALGCLWNPLTENVCCVSNTLSQEITFDIIYLKQCTTQQLRRG